MKKIKLLVVMSMLLLFNIVQAKEILNRGVVAVVSNNTDVFVSWRLLPTDSEDIAFNIYRSSDNDTPQKLNDEPITTELGTNFVDVSADLSLNNQYIVKPIIDGEEVIESNLKSGSTTGSSFMGSSSFTLQARNQGQLKATSASEPCVVVPIRGGNLIHFVWVGDLNGDGALDYVVDRLDWANGGCKIEAYKHDGTYLWTVDYGPNSKNMNNISPGSATISVGHNDGVTVGDINGDGKAEVITKIANGVKLGDGSTWTNSNNNKQWIAVLNGTTGAIIKYCAVPTDYLSVGPLAMRMGIGNTNEIFMIGKNRNADKSFNDMVCCFKMGSSLTLKWKKLGSSYSGADAHNIRIVDVNEDGVDDFVNIGYALNGVNGSQLWSLSGVVHGDRFLIGKFDNSRAGLQGYAIQQDNPSGLREFYYDAKTGKMIWQHYGAVGDLARGNAADLDPNYDGYEVWTFDGLYNAKSNTLISSGYPYPVLRMQWDADILDESYNDGKIENWNYSTKSVERQLTTWNYYSATSSDRGAPMFLGDIIGDWREEAILTSSDFSKLIIFTTNIPTTISRPSFRNDRYYLNCLSTKGYVQSSYTSYYMGDQSQTYNTIKNRATSLLVDGMGRTANGSNCGQWTSSGSNNQQWIIEGAGDYVKIKNRATGLYLDGMGRTSNGSICGLYSSSSSNNQQWKLEYAGSYVKFKNRATGLYLDGMGSTSNGSDICQWSSSGSYNQQFILSSLKSTAVSELEAKTNVNDESFEIFPNPASSYADVAFYLEQQSDVSIEIFDLSGKLISTSNLQNVNPGKIIQTIDLSCFHSGTYLVYVKTANQIYYSKLIKL
ncbi:MAG: RICIN domain-containing protein [Marinilabiliaceae bacterium]|nr:RICIN domain-containing protein [Marinilabiliaceae bacterium]